MFMSCNVEITKINNVIKQITGSISANQETLHVQKLMRMLEKDETPITIEVYENAE